MSNQNPVEIDAASGQVIEYTPAGKPARYRCKLDTLPDVRREMAKLYREARSGLVDVGDATKLTWCLQAVGKALETAKQSNDEILPHEIDISPANADEARKLYESITNRR